MANVNFSPRMFCLFFLISVVIGNLQSCRKGNCNWELIFRAKAGSGQKVMKAWFGEGYDTCTPDGCHLRDGCFQDRIDITGLAISSNIHLRSRIIDRWAMENIKQVKLALFKDGKEVVYVIFNANATSNANWFTSSRMIQTSWCDMDRSGPFNHFSIKGLSDERTFHINKAYSGCPKGVGWLAVSEGRVWCTWDRHSSYPQFLYAKKGRITRWDSKEFGKADVFDVFIQRD